MNRFQNRLIVATLTTWSVACGSLLGIDGVSPWDGDAGAPPSEAAATDTGSRETVAPESDATDAAANDATTNDTGTDGPSIEAEASLADVKDVAEKDVTEAACTPPTTVGVDDCTGIGSLPAAPVIDGTIECGVPLWPIPTIHSAGDPVPAGVGAELGAAWRADGLYLFVHVKHTPFFAAALDAGVQIFCGDAVELFVDSTGTYIDPPSYNMPGTLQFVVSSPGAASSSSHVAVTYAGQKPQGPWAGKFISVATTDGYAVEAFISATDLGLTSWVLQSGRHVGLDVAIDVGEKEGGPTGCGTWLGQFAMNLSPSESGCVVPSCSVEAFCNPVLSL